MNDIKHICDCSTGEVQETVLTDDEQAAFNSMASAWEAGATDRANQSLLRQIDQIEQINAMPRPLRDMLLQNTSAPGYAKVKLIDDQISALRKQITN